MLLIDNTARKAPIVKKSAVIMAAGRVLRFSCFYVLILIFLSCIPDTIRQTYRVYEGLPSSKIFERPKRDFASHFAGLRHSPNTGNVRHLDFVSRSTRFGSAEYRIYRHMASVSWWFTDCPLATRPFVVKTSRESKEKRASCPCLYYANSTACRRILLCAGDISPNPGPVTKCYKCEKPVKKNQFSLHCSVCYNLYHVNCTDRKQISKSANLGTWTCSCCLWSILPFNHVRSDCLDHQATETSIDNLPDCHQNALTANNSHLSIMHLNTQCMTSTFAEFTVLINSYNFDIIALSETWLKDNPLLLQHVSVPGYQLCYNNRNVCKGGGVGAYIKDSIVFKRRKDIENLQPEFEHMWLEIPGKNKNSKLLLGVLYRSTRILNSNDWIEKFEDLLSNIVPTWEGMFVMTGDMNINMFNVSDPFVSRYTGTLQSFNLTQHVSKPTRVTPTSRTLIDHLISNDPQKISHTDVLPCPSISDHDAVYATVNVRVKNYLPRHKFIRNMKNFEENAYQQDFSTLPLSVVYGLESIDDKVSVLNSLITECIDRHAPLMASQA